MNDEFGAQPEGPAKNPLGLVGFILAFCLPPIGLLLSLAALRKMPRGFAIAGTVIGLLGSIGIAAVVGVSIMQWPLLSKSNDIQTDYVLIGPALDANRDADGAWPTDVTALGLPEQQTVGPWGGTYVIEVAEDGASWELICLGPDGTLGTSDDITVPSGLGIFEMGRVIQDQVRDVLQTTK